MSNRNKVNKVHQSEVVIKLIKTSTERRYKWQGKFQVKNKMLHGDNLLHFVKPFQTTVCAAAGLVDQS
eukprot:5637735-Amphidinium_carterae.1